MSGKNDRAMLLRPWSPTILGIGVKLGRRRTLPVVCVVKDERLCDGGEMHFVLGNGQAK